MTLRKLRWILILYALCDFLIGYAGVIPLSEAAAAQFTTVTATVVDPNGIAYAGGTVSAILVVPSGAGSPTLSGFAYTPPTQPTGLSPAGFFTISLADTTVLLPAGSKWNFTVCSGAGTIQPAQGKGPVCFSLAAPITISGASQDISTQLNAVAASLSNAASSFTGGTIAGPLVVNGAPTAATFNSITNNAQYSSFYTSTQTSGNNVTGFNQVAIVNPAGASSNNYFSYLTDIEVPAANTQNFSGSMIGSQCNAIQNGSGNFTSSTATGGLGCFAASTQNNGTGTVTLQIGIYNLSVNKGNGAITSNIAFDGNSGHALGDTGTITNDYTFRAELPGFTVGSTTTHHYGFGCAAGQTGGSGNADGWCFFSALTDKSQLGVVTGTSYSTVASNGGLTGIGGDGTALTANTANTGYIVPCNTGASTLCTVTNRLNLSWGSGHFGAIPAIGAVGTSGHIVTLAANGIDIQDSGVVTSAGAIPRASRWQANSPTGVANWIVSGTSASGAITTQNGTFAAVGATATEEQLARYTSGAVSGNDAGFASNANPGPWSPIRNLYGTFRVRDNNADLTNQRFWLGFVDSETDAIFNGDTPGTAHNLAMFRFSSVVPDTNWQCVTGNASAQTTTNSSTVADTNFHVYEIQMNTSIPNVVFKIDGTTVCTNTTNLPGSTLLSIVGVVTTQTTAAKVLDAGWVYAQQDF